MLPAAAVMSDTIPARTVNAPPSSTLVTPALPATSMFPPDATIVLEANSPCSTSSFAPLTTVIPL